MKIIIRFDTLGRIACVLVGCYLACWLGCDSAFDPRGPLDQKIVTFSVLSTDRDIQLVRVQLNYMPPSNDPLSQPSDLPITDARVTLESGGRSYVFRDTSITRWDTQRYPTKIRAYYLSRFTPQRGKSYQLTISSPTYGLVVGNITMPESPKFGLDGQTRFVLDEPNKYGPAVPLIFTGQLSKHTKGYVARLILYYDVMKSGAWQEEAVEIPISSYDSAAYNMNMPVYPKMTVASATSGAAATYRNGYYKGALNMVNARYQSTQVIFKWATFVVLQADTSLYDYYANTHAVQDPFSIRLDEPLVSSVNGGIGLIGAYSLDSAVYLLPYNFWGNR